MITKKNRYSVTQEICEIQQDQFLNSSVIEKHTDNELLNNALHYADIGYPVFPLHGVRNLNQVLSCTCQFERNCSASGKHPRTRHGLKDATTDKERILEWWKRNPDSNIGLLTGKEVGFFALDIDLKHGGEFSLEELQDIYRVALGSSYVPLPATLTTNTGSGGRHLYFKHPMRFSIKSSVAKIGEGLDIRGEGGYIVAPPSKHIIGKTYDWCGMNIPLEDCPNWLVYEIKNAESAQKARNDLLNVESHPFKRQGNEKILESSRHNHFFRYLSGLVNTFSKEEVLIRAMKWNEERLEPPFSEAYVSYHVNYIYKRYGNPKNNDMGMKK